MDEKQLAEIRKRAEENRAKWGPTCARCGDAEFRVDGYCSIYCRDMAEVEEEVQNLRAWLRAGADIIQRGVVLMPIEQLSKWEGVRWWLEMTADDCERANVEVGFADGVGWIKAQEVR